jgi:hypothetical protein
MKGPVSHRVEVLRYNPYKRLFRRALAIVVALAVAMMIFWAGSRGAGQRLPGEDAETVALASRIHALEDEIQSLKQTVTNLETALEIERTASSAIRSELAAEKAQAGRLQTELEVYQSLMDTSIRTKGLGVHRFELSKSASADVVHYRLTLLQRAPGKVQLTGTISLTVKGLQGGQSRVLKLAQMSSTGQPDQLRLQLVYFQTYEGDLRLPEGFTPNEVRIVAVVTKGRPQKLDVVKEWKLEES